MSEKNKDELIETQNQVIGILFEVIKRFQANNELDKEYFELISSEEKTKNQRLEKIINIRKENSMIIGKLLEQFKI